MPVLHPAAKRFQGFAIADRFAGSLPPVELDGKWNPAAAKLNAPANWKLHFKSAEFISRATLIRTATTAGIMASRRAPLKVVFSLVPKNSATFGAGAEAILGPAVQAWSSALSGAFSRVPVAGWMFSLAELGYRFVQAARDAAKAKDWKASPPPVEGFAYNAQTDDNSVQNVIDEAETKDWTRMFLPPAEVAGAASAALERKAVSWTQDGEGQGHRFIFPDVASAGLGLIPGLADCSTGGWEYPSKVWGSNRPAGIESLVFQADTLPALRQCALLMWQGVLKNSSRMFSVDTRDVISQWQDYFGALDAWATWNQVNGRGQVAQMAKHAGVWRWDQGAAGGLRSRYDRFDPKKLSIGSGMGDLIKHIVKTQLEASQRPALRTLTCAYVHPNAPAFRGRKKLAAYHEKMRAKLLKHPARFDVELDMVPDKGFRDDVREATRVPLPTFTAGGVGSSKPSRVDGVAAVDDGDELPPDDDVAPGLPGGLGETGGGGVGMALGLIALTAAGVAVMRGR